MILELFALYNGFPATQCTDAAAQNRLVFSFSFFASCQ